MEAIATDALGQRLVELRRVAEPADPRALDSPCPLALAVITHRGRILMGLNRWRREWELPGGLIEADEDARAAASRELLEETGLSIEPHQLRWLGLAVFDLVNPARRELAAVFTAHLTEPAITVGTDELIEVAWLDLQAPPQNHSPLDLALAAHGLAQQSDST